MFKFISFVLANLDKYYEKPGAIGAPGNTGVVDKGYGIEQDLEILREGNEDEEEGDASGKKTGKKPTEEETEETEEDIDDDATEEDSEEEQEETDDEESDEEDEEETEEEEEGIDEIDEHKIAVKDIKKNFPDFFKKHPEMKGVIFRERQFSEIFNTPQEAQYAARLASQFQGMEADLISGNTVPLFEAIKKANDGKSYEGFISNLLPNLQKTDSDTYYKVVAVPIKKALRAAFADGTNRGNKNLAFAAQYINEFLFGSTNVSEKVDFEDKAKSVEKTKEQKEYEEKLQQLNIRDHTNYKKSVDAEWQAGIEEAFFDGLDPDNILSDWTKSKMAEDAIVELNKQMVKDPRYMRIIEGLWAQAANSGYNPGFKTRIVNTSLARAKQIIPSIRQKLRAEALSERRKIHKSKEGKGHEKRRVVAGRDSNGRKPLDKKAMRSMSDLDIIRS